MLCPPCRDGPRPVSGTFWVDQGGGWLGSRGESWQPGPWGEWTELRTRRGRCEPGGWVGKPPARGALGVPLCPRCWSGQIIWPCLRRRDLSSGWRVEWPGTASRFFKTQLGKQSSPKPLAVKETLPHGSQQGQGSRILQTQGTEFCQELACAMQQNAPESPRTGARLSRPREALQRPRAGSASSPRGSEGRGKDAELFPRPVPTQTVPTTAVRTSLFLRPPPSPLPSLGL